MKEKLKLLTDNVLSNLEAIFLVLKFSGNESWKNQFYVKVWIFGKTQLRDDTWGLPSRGSFFPKNTFLDFGDVFC